MTHGLFRIALAVGFVAIFAPAAYAGKILLDDVFLNANWTGSIVLDTQPTTTDPTFSAAQAASGGVADSPYRRTEHAYGPNNNSTASAGLVVAHLGLPLHHDPGSEGAITSLDLSFSARAFEVGASGAIGYGALLFQDGSYYSAGFVNVIANSWSPFLFSSLTASSFNLVSGVGPVNPDFSVAGAPITFGYFTSNGTSGRARTSTISGIDDYQLTLTTVPDQTATLTLFGLGLAATAISRRFGRV